MFTSLEHFPKHFLFFFLIIESLSIKFSERKTPDNKSTSDTSVPICMHFILGFRLKKFKLLLKIFSFHKRQSFQYYLEQEPLIVFFKSFHSITKCEIQTGRW